MKRRKHVNIEQGSDGILLLTTDFDCNFIQFLQRAARLVRVGSIVEVCVHRLQRIDARRYRQRWGSPVAQLSLLENDVER